MEQGPSSRRKFLSKSLGLTLASWAFSRSPAAWPAVFPNPVGYAAIAWPQEEFSHALDTISNLGFKGVQVLGWVREAYSGAKTIELKQRLNSLKLQPVTLSCSDLEMNPSEQGNEVAEFRGYANFFRLLGGRYLQITDGGSPLKKYADNEIKKLGVRMTALGKLAGEYGLTLGYHPHFGTMGETREGLGRILDATDPQYVKLIVDVAHVTLGGSDPVELVRTYRDRLILAHFKDLRKDVAELAKQNRNLVRKKEHLFCELGEGVVNFPAILQAFRDTQFRGWIVIELDGGDMTLGSPDKSARKNKASALKFGLAV